QVIQLAYPVLKQLQRELDETVNLGILSGQHVIYVETLAPESSFAFYAPPGTQMPLYCTAMGKLFLAHLPPAELERALDGLALTARTPHTIASVDALLAALPA